MGICIGSKDGGSEKFLAMVSALLAGDLSDAQNLNGAVLSSRSWGHTLSLWHGTAKPGDRAAQMLESELRALVDEVSISFHQHRKTLIYHSARGEELREVPEEYKNPAKLRALHRLELLLECLFANASLEFFLSRHH